MTDIAVTTPPPDGGGWTCQVRLTDTDGSASEHRVRVSRADLERYAPGASDPTGLVRRSFAFLLDHEPRSAILRTFDLSVIARYFPEYEREIRGVG